MRSLIIAAAALGLLATPLAATAAAKAGNDKMSTCAAAWKAMSAAEKAGKTYKEYSSACLKGPAATTAAAPAAAAKPAMAAAKPAMSAAKPAMAAAKPAMAAKVTKAKSGPKEAGGLPTTRPAGATAQCKDNTWSSAKNHSGACAGHGGVAQWL